jgi:hypothetical protein
VYEEFALEVTGRLATEIVVIFSLREESLRLGLVEGRAAWMEER